MQLWRQLTSDCQQRCCRLQNRLLGVGDTPEIPRQVLSNEVLSIPRHIHLTQSAAQTHNMIFCRDVESRRLVDHVVDHAAQICNMIYQTPGLIVSAEDEAVTSGHMSTTQAIKAVRPCSSVQASQLCITGFSIALFRSNILAYGCLTCSESGHHSAQWVAKEGLRCLSDCSQCHNLCRHQSGPLDCCMKLPLG